MRRLVGEHIETLKAYVPGKPIEELKRERGITGEVLKLASNENPLGSSPMALEAARVAMEECFLYPDGAAFGLRQRVATELNVGMEQVAVGNGSNELIELLVRTFATPEDNAVVSDYSFIIYRLALDAMGVPWVSVPMREGMVHDLSAMADAVDARTRLVFIANPNNPTGTYNGADELGAFLDRLSALPDRPLVIMDEAYIEYADAADFPDSMDYHGRYDRLVTMRTFSKCYGLAALRVGYTVSNPQIAGYLNKMRAPFNVNRVGQAAAVAAMDDVDFLRRTVTVNNAERARMTVALREAGVEVLPSQTNFLFCRAAIPGAEVYDRLLNHGVIVRPLDGYGLAPWVRISLGTPAQNDRMLAALVQELSP